MMTSPACATPSRVAAFDEFRSPLVVGVEPRVSARVGHSVWHTASFAACPLSRVGRHWGAKLMP